MRANNSVIRATDLDALPVEIKAQDFEAIVLPHEIDHLSGPLLSDNVAAKERARNEWRARNLSNIHARLQPLKDKPEGVILERQTFGERIVLVNSHGQIRLYFASPSANRGQIQISGIMSRIDPSTPLTLLGVYMQAMMLALCWRPDPRRVYIIGFGGGRIPMVLHHYLSDCAVDGAEINAVVAGIAHEYFGIKEDDRMHIAVEDGREWLNKTPVDQRYDIILVDCFTGNGNHPYSLSTTEFYCLCKSRLVHGGVVATNLVESDSLFAQKLSTFVESFGHVIDFEYQAAHVLFGSENLIEPEEIMSRAQELDSKYSFEFPFIEHSLRLTKKPAALVMESNGNKGLADRDQDTKG